MNRPQASAAGIDAVNISAALMGQGSSQMGCVVVSKGWLQNQQPPTASRNVLCMGRNGLKLHYEGGGAAGSTCHFSSCLPDGQDCYGHKDAR